MIAPGIPSGCLVSAPLCLNFSSNFFGQLRAFSQRLL